MRPTTDELLVGMRNVLEDVLVPELESDWAQTMGTQMALMLQHLEGRGEREPRFMAEENAKLEDVLAKANGALGEEAVAVRSSLPKGRWRRCASTTPPCGRRSRRRSTRPTPRGSTASTTFPRTGWGSRRR